MIMQMKYLLFFLLIGSVATSIAAEPVSLLEIGRRIYQDGLLESGEPLQGVSAAQVILHGKQAACITCHRKSGMGSGEGKSVVRPIAGKYLFPAEAIDENAPRLSEMHKRAYYRPSNSRAAYTRESFAKVMRDGEDYGGQTLESLMPRFALNDKEIEGLSIYLKTLSTKPDPGVDLEEIHFSTIVMPDAKLSETKAMLDVLNAFFADKNGGSRSEGKRQAVGSEAMYRSYRRWVLHVWTLTGPENSWSAQLEEAYRKQPVFSVVSGIGNSNWQPVHDFCERVQLPCLFPNTNLPVSDTAYYSFYLTRGMALEAEVLGKYFVATPGKQGAVVQVFNRHDNSGREAAKLMRDNFAKAGIQTDLVDWSFTGTPDIGSLRKILLDKPSQSVVLWLNGEDVQQLGGLNFSAYAPQQIILSASMLGRNIASESNLLGQAMQSSVVNIRIVYPYELPGKSAQLLLRTKLWLRARKMAVIAETVQANTYLAALITGDAVSHMLDQFYRDYFIERVEHMVARSVVTSVYPRLSLGPGQRFASKGAYLVRYSAQPGTPVEAVTEWIVPE